MSLARTALVSTIAAATLLLLSERLSAQDMPLRADSAEVNGTWIHYGTAGHGPPLLLLHGFTGAGIYWEPYLDRLAEHYTTIVPDLPGHGRSGVGPDPYRFDHVAADMLAFMDMLGVGRFRAVGYSSTGWRSTPVEKLR